MSLKPPEELAAAIESEREAWQLAKGRLPGTPHYDAQLWAAWRAALQRCMELRAQVDQGRSGPREP